MHAAKGHTIWLTGLSGSGKTTLSQMLAREFERRGMPCGVLDGDVVRRHVSKGLGFSREDREENIRRIGLLSRLLSRHGVTVIVAAISPYQEVRQQIRAQSDGGFVEIYVRCPVEKLIKRDTKGLYARALSGELKQFTGISDVYEPPANPELIVDTGEETPSESLERLLSRLKDLGCLPSR